MGDLNADEIEIAARGYDALYEHIAGIREELIDSTAEQGKEMMASLLSPVDRDALTDDLAAFMHANAMEALAPGAAGWTDESLAEFQPWGFELDAIAVPVQVWHGEEDRFVPVGHARWLVAHIPGAEARIFAGEGHISVVQKSVGDMLGWLVARSAAGTAA
jgi:pimeloyl-ACP methyl ester carboxylesterase